MAELFHWDSLRFRLKTSKRRAFSTKKETGGPGVLFRKDFRPKNWNNNNNNSNNNNNNKIHRYS